MMKNSKGTSFSFIWMLTTASDMLTETMLTWWCWADTMSVDFRAGPHVKVIISAALDTLQCLVESHPEENRWRTKCCRFIHHLIINLHLQSETVFILLWSMFSQLSICSINIENGLKTSSQQRWCLYLLCQIRSSRRDETADSSSSITERRWISSSWCDVVSSRFDSWIISPTSSSTWIMSQCFILN